MKKKILFLVTKSNFGGAQRYVFTLATALANNHDVVVAAGEEPGSGVLFEKFSNTAIQTRRVPHLVRDIRPLSDVKALIETLRLLRAEKPSIVHVNSSKAGGIGSLAARICRVPRIVFTVHGIPYDEARSPVARAFLFVFTWLSCILSHSVIAVSAENTSRLRALPFLKKKVIHIPNGAMTPATLSREDARREIESLIPAPLPSHAWIGMIAELTNNKNIETALETIRLLPETELFVIGDGELRATLLKNSETLGIDARVHFLGYIDEAARLLQAFDVFLLTSRKEGLPYVLIEAALTGIPIATSELPGTIEILGEKYPHRFPAHDAAACAHVIRELLDDRAQALELARELKESVSSHFSLEEQIAQTRGVYALPTNNEV